MDAEGNIVAKPRARNVDSFEMTRVALGEHAKLTQRIEGGEKGLDAALLLCEHALGKVDTTALAERANAVTDATKEQSASIAQILVDEEFQAIVRGARGDVTGPAKELLAMLEAGKKPTAGSSAHSGLWRTLSRYAMETRDPELALRSAAGVKAAYADNRAADTYVEGLEKAAAKLGEWTKLTEKTKAGSNDLAADLALVEYELRFLAPKAFLAKAEGLLATASDDQKKRLNDAILKASFEQHVNAGRTRDPDVLEAAAKALLAMIDGGKNPPRDMQSGVWSVISRYGLAASNPDVIERAADGFEATGNKRFAGYVGTLRKRVTELREKSPE